MSARPTHPSQSSHKDREGERGESSREYSAHSRISVEDIEGQDYVEDELPVDPHMEAMLNQIVLRSPSENLSFIAKNYPGSAVEYNLQPSSNFNNQSQPGQLADDNAVIRPRRRDDGHVGAHTHVGGGATYVVREQSRPLARPQRLPPLRADEDYKHNGVHEHHVHTTDYDDFGSYNDFEYTERQRILPSRQSHSDRM